MRNKMLGNIKLTKVTNEELKKDLDRVQREYLDVVEYYTKGERVKYNKLYKYYDGIYYNDYKTEHFIEMSIIKKRKKVPSWELVSKYEDNIFLKGDVKTPTGQIILLNDWYKVNRFEVKL